jgi:sigma-B regulation protein RsbU (phosphoserine phosphatase)
MAVTRTLLRATALQNLSAGSCLEYVNSVLVGQSDSAMFVTVFYGILDLRTGELEYAVGGHNPPYLFAPANIRMLPVKAGLIVGVIGDADYETQRVRLQPGEGILLYTDGITEADNAAGEFFEERGLEEWLRRSASLPLSELVGGLVKQVQEFAGEHPQADDLTALAVRYLG